MMSRYFDNVQPNSRPKRTGKKRKSTLEDDVEACPSVNKVGKPTAMPRDTSATVAHQPSTVGTQPNAVTGKLGHAFYDVPCAALARNLLGQHVVRSIGGQKIIGRIVETEAYIGPIDKAAHSYQGKRTPRNGAMFMRPGTCYVYNIYGMYCCMNISSQGEGAAVLLRALQPIEGQSLMEEGRKGKAEAEKKPLKEKDLANGPSKLCQALHISKNDFNQTDLTSSDSLWLEAGDCVEKDEDSVVECARINIGYAQDWKDTPLRFYLLGNKCVSVRDKKAEASAKVKDTDL